MICKNCGGNISDDARFCNLCGAPVTEPAASEQEEAPVETIVQPAPALVRRGDGASRAVSSAVALLTIVTLLLGWFSFKMELPWSALELEPGMAQVFDSGDKLSFGISATPFSITNIMRQYKKLFTDMGEGVSVFLGGDINEVDSLVSVMGIAEIIFLMISALIVLAVLGLGCFVSLSAVRPGLGALLGQIGSICAFAGAFVFGALMLVVSGVTGMAMQEVEGISLYIGNSPVVGAVIILSVAAFVLITVFKKKWLSEAGV